MDRKKLALMLLGAAGAACTVAIADTVDQAAPRFGRKVLVDDVKTLRNGAGTFGDRDVIPFVIVYDAASTSFVNAGFTTATCSHILEDINLAGGPYGPSFAGPRVLDGMQYSYGLSGSAATWDMRFSFYRPSEVSFLGVTGTGSSMIDPAATPYYTLTVTGFDTNICPGFVTRTGFFALPSTVEMPTGDSALWLEAAIVEPGTPGTAPLTSTNLFTTNIATTRVTFFFGNNTGARLVQPGQTIPAGSNQLVSYLDGCGNPAAPGRSNPAYGRDSDFSGVFEGQSLAYAGAGTFPFNNCRYFHAGTATAQTCSYVFGLTGQLPSAAAAPSAISLNTGSFLSDGPKFVSGSLSTATQLRWYKFNTKFDISYDAGTYLDIDTENSDQPVAFAMYTPDGLVFDIAESRGNGPDPVRPSEDGLDNYQISYGTARRPGIGDGVQYSGQEGVLPAGEHYMVAAMSGAGFGDGWSITPVDPGLTVNYFINIDNNNQKTIPVPPAVSPALSTGGDQAILKGVDKTTPDLDVPARVVQWVRFSLTNPLPTTGQVDPETGDPLSDVTYLDITMPGSSSVGEWNLCLYNNGGTLASGTSISYAGAGFNDNTGGGDGAYGCGGTFAQLSYGTAPSRGVVPLDPDQVYEGRPLDNQNGLIGGDQYYLAVSMGTALFNNGRWGARSTRGSSLTAVITLSSNNRGPSGGCPADFNGDAAVDDTDFVYFNKYYNDYFNLAGDIDGSADGITDDTDFTVFAAAYNDYFCP
ncbi:MAG: hypothetical protein U0573_03055 [Phycisphaerales bacterium]|nr:hypothetical protein [Planctomycetota bacterium]